VLETSMRLMHPIMPFLTEQIWQSIPHEGESIMIAPFPKADQGLIDGDAEKRMEAVMEVIRAVRTLRSEMDVPPGRKVEAILVTSSSDIFAAGQESIKSLARLSKLEFVTQPPSTEHARFVSAHLPMADVYIPLAGLVDVDKETARLTNELAEVEKELARTSAKLSNEQFISKAPAHIIEKEQRIAQELTDKKAKLEERLATLR